MGGTGRTSRSGGSSSLLPWVAAGLSGCVYVLTLSPTVASPRDAAELSLAAITSGIPHPTGYPLYMLLGRLWVELVPVGDPGWRLNLLSALCSAAAIGLLTHLLCRILVSRTAAWVAAMAFAFSPVVWSQSNVAEVYPLHLLLQVAILLCWRSWEVGGEFRWLCLLAALVGLSFTHHLMTLLTLPCLGLAALMSLRRWWSVRNALVLLGLLVLPLGLYAYLPIVLAYDPQIAWTDLSTPALQWEHVTGGPYRALTVSVFDDAFRVKLARYPAGFERQFLVLAALVPLGWWAQWKDPKLFYPVLAGYLASTYFALTYLAIDADAFYLPSCLFATLWIASGADWLLGAIPGSFRIGRGAVRVAYCVLPALPLALNYAEQDQGDRWAVYDRDMAALAVAAPDDVLLVWGDSNFPFYASRVHGVRPDVEIVELRLNLRGDYDPGLQAIRRRRDLVGNERIRATLEVVRRLGGRPRNLVALPVEAGAGWQQLGFRVVEGGVLNSITPGSPDLRISVPRDPEGGPAYPSGLALAAVRLARSDVAQGDIVFVDYDWVLGAHAPEPASVLTFLGDRAGDAPRDAAGAPRFAFSHRLGLGTDLGALAPGESIRERLALQIPYDLPVGRWTLWVGIARGAGFVPMVDGSAVSARASLDVSVGERELWVLPRVHR